ncbi:DUF4232 domain-containing protein [Streptomyces sp. NPDC020362]|uniref:DUF4232 domain-containing protein n=1 Tax=unclassified Streptomyces TaxID=2593676 RepID=UPI0033C7F134
MVQRKATVLMLSLAMLLGLTACGWGRWGHARAATCGSPQLGWKWTRLADRPAGAPVATLSGRNKSAKPCAFDGYPQLHVWVGKAQDVLSEPKKKAKPVRLVLNPGHTVDFPLFYQPHHIPRRFCWIAGDDNAGSDVVPPHRAQHDYGSFVHVTDAKGHRLPTQVCSDTIQLGPPHLR